ncbi:MAG TPA: phosphosulfolactate synthase, partial [Nitrososphaeraceae archaeon]|nr:phosphosulfolactate synthase [Nitrososphaeraceae archaeon]
MFKDLSKNRIDNKKPRKEGLTYIIDKLSSLDKDTFEILSPEIDMVKIYNVFPLLMSESQLSKRISFYHDLDIPVST